MENTLFIRIYDQMMFRSAVIAFLLQIIWSGCTLGYECQNEIEKLKIVVEELSTKVSNAGDVGEKKSTNPFQGMINLYNSLWMNWKVIFMLFWWQKEFTIRFNFS